MPRDAVSRTANVERNGGHKWVNINNPRYISCPEAERLVPRQNGDNKGPPQYHSAVVLRIGLQTLFVFPSVFSCLFIRFFLYVFSIFPVFQAFLFVLQFFLSCLSFCFVYPFLIGFLFFLVYHGLPVFDFVQNYH